MLPDEDILRIAAAVRDSIAPVLQEAVRAGAVQAAAQIARDSEFMGAYWERGYETLVKHGREDVQKGLGRRLLTWLAGAAFGVGIYLATKAGVLK
jgi:hypothetical protein